MNNDSLVTLDEALAFIDFCEDGNTTARPSTSTDDLLPLNSLNDFLDTATNGEEYKLQQSSSEAIESLPKKKKRFRNAAYSSTALQRRRKAETQALRKEAHELEGYLAMLKRRHSSNQTRVAKDNLGKHDNEWHHRALAEYQKRLQAEQVNTRLKGIMDTQLQLGNKMRDVLSKRSTHWVSLSSNPPMLRSSVEPSYDERFESETIQFSTTTPLDCSCQAVFDSLWSFFKTFSVCTLGIDSLQSKYASTLYHRGCAIRFNKLQYLRKFEEKDRIIIIWANYVLIPSTKLQYRTLGYTAIIPSHTDPLNGCVVHTKHKLYVECGANKPSGVLKTAHNTALCALSTMMRTFWNSEQNRMLADAAHVAVE
ncbi:Hypothetical protein PHPALM_6105 [Phytophthora palmivora]|uniref:M96 mating-specific protein family n=1 Tax=Phytophthora palmivora TaxID=4796 RepID=A0A2P4YFP1_9STRA|nr:Hypothetical protein PHPALM_6105 [Phytophthora palmivora]